MRIGIAGLGRMGAAMAARLIEVGHQVTVWNRSAGKAKPLVDAGAKTAASATATAATINRQVACIAVFPGFICSRTAVTIGENGDGEKATLA